MYIYDNNVSHRFQGLHDSVYSSHDFVYSVIGRLPSPDHDRTLTDGRIGYSVFEAINNKSNLFIHKIVQVHGLMSHFHHHANL